MERAIARNAVGIEGLYPYALVISEWGPWIGARAAAQRHSDLAGRFGGNTRAADGGDKGAVADIAGEEDLVDSQVQFGGAQNIATADETSIALDDPPEFPDATALYPPP